MNEAANFDLNNRYQQKYMRSGKHFNFHARSLLTTHKIQRYCTVLHKILKIHYKYKYKIYKKHNHQFTTIKFFYL